MPEVSSDSSQPPARSDPRGHTPTSRPPRTVAAVFFGPDGLRAGWAIAAFLLLLGVILSPIVTLLRRLWTVPPAIVTAVLSRHELTVAYSLLQSAPSLLLLLFTTFLMALIERRRFGVYGLGGIHRLRFLLLGAATGLVAISLLMAVLLLTHHLVLDHVLLTGVPALHSGLLWLVAFALVAALEESLLRGFLQYTLARGLGGAARAAGLRHGRALGFAAAAVLLSLLFGASHRNNPGESPFGLATATLAGLVWCLALFRTGSLWWAIGFHALWDWSESFLFGVPDSGMLSAGRLLATHPAGSTLLSGGTTGPEGSVFALLSLTFAAAAVLVTTRQQPLPPTAPQTRYRFEHPRPKHNLAA